MSGGSPKKPTKPPAGTAPRKDKRKEPGTIPVTPVNPPAVGGGTVPREDRPKKK
ncbi:MAG TPA: hypothetical protein VH394_06730 [Thermoanaerobaculia bacterium]|jgi:hypothetical protein|nr:hypothetical protein [Thermoanaerobaculia bacterium]